MTVAKRSWPITGFLGVALVVGSVLMSAEPISVRYREGSIHGFLAMRTLPGKLVAEGDLVQTTKGDRVTSELVFRFKDGSIDSDTTVFSQHVHFRLISDHHIQKGPSFPTPMDLSIDAVRGQVTSRSMNEGEEKTTTDHLDLPPDLANGIILNILKNISPQSTETTVSYLVVTSKPRLVKLLISPQGKEAFSVASVKHGATRFVVKVQLGGLAGLIAPLMGKEPADTNVWIAEGKAPAFVRSDGPSYMGGPIWSIQMTSPDWSQAEHTNP